MIRFFITGVSPVIPRFTVMWCAVGVFTLLLGLVLWRTGRLPAAKALLLPVFSVYLAVLLTLTLFGRIPTVQAEYQLQLFWSYREIAGGAMDLLYENLWNVIAFVPAGFLLSLLLERPRLSLLLCGMLSLCIELTQLTAHLGLFEFDDLFHNTVGAAAGVLAYWIWLKKSA